MSRRYAHYARPDRARPPAEWVIIPDPAKVAARESRNRGKEYTPSSRVTLDYQTCECGKRGYRARDDARTVLRCHQDPGMDAYTCPESGLWHVGHSVAAQRAAIRSEQARRRRREEQGVRVLPSQRTPLPAGLRALAA